MMQPVYVTAAARCLPGAPVSNDARVEYIGPLSPEAERLGLSTELLHGVLCELKARQQAGSAA